jgi:ribonuclease VapC
VIAVDTSALMAVILGEPASEACRRTLHAEDVIVISAGTLAETLIVSGRRGFSASASRLIDALPLRVVPVTAASAERISDAYGRWGKGMHPAALNFGDCFAYEVATLYDCPLLFIGDDFARTDVKRALG